VAAAEAAAAVEAAAAAAAAAAAVRVRGKRAGWVCAAARRTGLVEKGADSEG